MDDKNIPPTASNSVRLTTANAGNNGIPFSQADGLSGSLQNGIKAFVTSHGGDATIQPSEIIRPKWSLVKDVMDGKKPLSVLSKNCPN